MQHAINSRKRKLDLFFQRAQSNNIDEETQSDLARYGAVLVCGYVERCVEVIILERLSNLAHPRVRKFIQAHFKRGTNYDCEAICQLLERFDPDWSQKFRAFLESHDEVVAAITSAYALRNSIAHGGDANRGLSGVIEIFNSAQIAVEKLVECTR